MNKISKTKLLLIDGNALIHRAFHALPPLTNKEGNLVNAVFGFTSVLLKAIKDLNPSHIIVAFDKKGPTFRHKIYKEYKATRESAPKELYQQIPIVHQVVKAMNIPYYEMRGYEADDIIGTLSKKAGIYNVIVTGDLDALQLVDNDTAVYTMRRGVQDTVLYDIAKVEERYGLKPDQLIDYKGLRGDPSDNIPGVSGVGEKTAIILLQEFGTIENMYNKLKQKNYQLEIKGLRGAKGLQKKLLGNEDRAMLSKKLATIILNMPLKINLQDCVLKDYDRGKVASLFHKLEFKSLLSRLPESLTDNKEQGTLFANSEEQAQNKKTKLSEKVKYNLIDDNVKLKQFLNKAAKAKEMVFDTETDSLDAMEAKLIGISFAWKEKEAYYLPEKILQSKLGKKVLAILTDLQIKKIAHNAKYDYQVMLNYGIEAKNIYFDTMIASYLLRAGSRRHNLDDLAFAEFGHEMISYGDLVGKGKNKKNISDVALSELAIYSCEDADYTLRLKNIYQPRLQENKKLAKLFYSVEMPLVFILADTERIGIEINVSLLKKLSKEFEIEINKLALKIYQEAGTKAFNINSSQQLSNILFEKLKISSEGIKKTISGFSTASTELKKIKDRHKIVALIEKYREMSKLKNTYVDTLPKLVNKNTGRVHTSYNQTVTATGRLSSSDPNLQNIPIRTAEGKKIRRSFVAAKGYKLLSLDYSQIELRVLAHLSKDKNLIQAFKENQDIHAATASILLDKKIEEVTKEDRRLAKTINFGLLYGMRAFGLSERLGIARDEAQKFIDSYFAKFPTILDFLNSILKQARKDGYIETLTGRIRYFPELQGGSPQVVAAAERMAINMPIQGLGADIIKIAMNNLKPLLNENDEIRMILQVHDELVFEIKVDKLKQFAEKIEAIMENAYDLVVPLKVDVSYGENWEEMKELK